jgi:hypothetical protein
MRGERIRYIGLCVGVSNIGILIHLPTSYAINLFITLVTLIICQKIIFEVTLSARAEVEAAVWSTRERLEQCLENNGRQFQHLR